MRIGILGGGSLGLMLTARLLVAGFDPILIVRSKEQRDLIREHGIVYTEGDFSQVVHPVVQTMEEELTPIDCLFLAVKQTQIPTTLPFLESLRDATTYLIPLQNGLGHIEKLRAVFPAIRICVGVTTEGAKRLSPYQVERTGKGTTWIGHDQMRNHVPPELSELFVVFRNAGIFLEWDTNILFRSWRKLLINAAINPLTGILGVRNGALLQSKSIRAVMKILLKEGLAVAKAEGFEISFEMWQEIEEVCRNTSKNYSSMLQDILAGKPTEIDFINGFIIQRGKVHHIPTHTHEVIVQLLRGKEEVHLGSESK